MEDLIWNRITDSAKKKFDYKTFESEFNKIDDNIAENIIFQIIVGFASDKTEEIIALELYNQMLMTGFVWQLDEIQKFIEDKKSLLKIEIYSAQLASSMLQDDNDPLSVLNGINQLLQ